MNESSLVKFKEEENEVTLAFKSILNSFKI